MTPNISICGQKLRKGRNKSGKNLATSKAGKYSVCKPKIHGRNTCFLALPIFSHTHSSNLEMEQMGIKTNINYYPFLQAF